MGEDSDVDVESVPILGVSTGQIDDLSQLKLELEDVNDELATADSVYDKVVHHSGQNTNVAFGIANGVHMHEESGDSDLEIIDQNARSTHGKVSS